MPRYFLRLSYNGTAYSGWQIQDNAVSVQGTLNDAISLLTKSKVETTGCGRTDTGVHASRYYAHFDMESDIADPDKLLYSLNAVLPHDIVIRELFRVEEGAHARYDAFRRTYEYLITTRKNPFLRELAHHVPVPLDLSAMQDACRHLIGTMDFTCFARSKSGNHNPVCTVYESHWKQEGDMLVFTISANRFLRNMVRSIVGTMLEIGSGKFQSSALPELIRSGSRPDAGPSAPACGLYLCEVAYPFIKNAGKGTLFDV